MWINLYRAMDPEKVLRNDYRLKAYAQVWALQYGDVDSSEYGMVLTGAQIWKRPAQRISGTYSVPGRNGTLWESDGCWDNVTLKYTFMIPGAFQERFSDFLNMALSLPGYQMVRDGIDPDHYRLGRLRSDIEPEMILRDEIGRFDLLIDCKPQRYLWPERRLVLEKSPGRIENPSPMAAKPLIKVSGSAPGTLHIGEYTVEIKAIKDHVFLDCERMTAYRQPGEGAPVNCNGDIWAPEFPQLHGYRRGSDHSIPISWTGGITSVEIEPRWWSI